MLETAVSMSEIAKCSTDVCQHRCTIAVLRFLPKSTENYCKFELSVIFRIYSSNNFEIDLGSHEIALFLLQVAFPPTPRAVSAHHRCLLEPPC